MTSEADRRDAVLRRMLATQKPTKAKPGAASADKPTKTHQSDGATKRGKRVPSASRS